jgi:formylglycine-generating enzyme required for sulfatase activity
MPPSPATVLRLREPGGERLLTLPCRIGATPGDEVLVPGIQGGGALLLHHVDGEAGVTPAAGTLVRLNGMPMPAGDFALLQPGDVITVGTAVLVWHGVVSAAASQATGDALPLLEVRHSLGNATVESLADDAAREINEATGDERIVVAELPSAASRPSGGASSSLSGANRRLLAIAALLLFAVLSFALLLSRLETVRVTVQPATAEVSGSGFGWRSGETLLLLPGERTIRAQAEGYLPVERAVTVRDDEPLAVALQLKEKPGIIEIDTGGVAARVFVDGAEAGRAPGAVQVAGGERTMILRAERHLDHVEKLVVAGRGTRQPLNVRLQPSWGVLEVSATTADATLVVDAAAPVTLPARVDLPAGLHRIRIAAPGAKDWLSAVLLKAGETQRIGPIQLGAPDARLRVTSRPAGAQVTVGGLFSGRTPVTVALPAGSEHDIGVSLQGYRPAESRVFATSGKDIALAVTLQAVPVKLTVQGDPADAELVLDGVVRGKTPLTVELPARRHSFEVRKAGMQTERLDVDLSAAVERTVEYKLVPVGRARDWKPPAPALRAQTGTLLRLIEGGAYTMGSERREQGRRANEFPRRVTLSRPFYLGTREVTNGEFRRFKATHAAGFVGKRTLDLDGQPASSVSWTDAVQYCNWLSAQEGLPPAYEQKGGRWVLVQPVTTGYRLPTEAEWEYVARHAGPGARTQRYEWGDALPPPEGIGNLAGSEAAAEMSRVLEGWQDDYQVVAPPGKFRANGFGIFDMTGNVSEWVHDAYVSFEANAGGTDPIGPAAGGTRHVIKGSNWRTAVFADLRAAWREGADAGSQDIGFRVARYAE